MPPAVPVFANRRAGVRSGEFGHTTQTAFFDYDLDGDLDACLLTNAIGGSTSLGPKKLNERGKGRSTDHIFRKVRGTGSAGHPFSGMSREAGILRGYGLGLPSASLNADGWRTCMRQ